MTNRQPTADIQALRAARKRLSARAGRIAAALGVFAGPGGCHRHRIHRPAQVTSTRVFSGRGRLVTAEELAALAHVPADERLTQVERAGARPVAPVTAIPHRGRGVKSLGCSVVTGRPIALPAADTRHHVHVVGATGVGKSTLLANMVLADIRDRRGVVVVDPKGDLIDDIVDRLEPDEVADRLRLIDPAQKRHMGLNPLAGDDADLVTDNFVSICRTIWPRHWGPRADDILRSGVLTLMGSDNPVLDALAPLLTSKKERAKITARMHGPLGSFWAWYDTLPGGIQAQAVGPVLARIRALMTRAFVHDTIGAPASDIDVRAILDDAGILLVRLPKGQIGDDTARLLGSVVVARVWQAATARSGIAEHRRRDASLYIDECHNFLALPRALDEVLAEARGYRLSLVLAHQHMAQLPREMQFAISANARTKLIFHVSPEDARLLSRHTMPHMTEHDLSHLDAYTAAARMFTAGREQPAFTLATMPPAERVGKAAAIRRHATPPAPSAKDKSGDNGPGSAPIPGASAGASTGPGCEGSPPRSPDQAAIPQVTRGNDGTAT